MRLIDLAFSRSSDKGNHCDLSLIAYDQEKYQLLVEKVTKEALCDYFSPLGPSTIDLFRLDNLSALKIVLYDVLDGGAANSIKADTQGKSLSGALLRMEI